MTHVNVSQCDSPVLRTTKINPASQIRDLSALPDPCPPAHVTATRPYGLFSLSFFPIEDQIDDP